MLIIGYPYNDEFIQEIKKLLILVELFVIRSSFVTPNRIDEEAILTIPPSVTVL
jgi:hypothetical protein